MKGAVTPYTEALLEVFFRALKDQDSEVLSNAAFAVGLLVEHSETDISPHLGLILQALHPLFINISEDATPTRLNAKDNATGAVARIIEKYSNAIPLDQVLPIFVGALPLKNDPLENRPVFRAIFHLFQTNSPALAGYLDQLLPAFAFVLDPTQQKDQLGDDQMRSMLINLIGMINQEAPQKVQAAGLGPFLSG